MFVIGPFLDCSGSSVKFPLTFLHFDDFDFVGNNCKVGSTIEGEGDELGFTSSILCWELVSPGIVEENELCTKLFNKIKIRMIVGFSFPPRLRFTSILIFSPLRKSCRVDLVEKKKLISF